MTVSEDFLVLFSPETWSPARRFASFIGPPFSGTHHFANAPRAVENRRQKISVLADLARYLRPGLHNDQQELDTKGYTSAMSSRRYSAIVETIFQELYSTLDALRQTIFATYGSVRRVQNESTNRLFQRAHDNSYGPGFPEPIRQALSAAFLSWLPELRRIRVEVTHGDIGSCHLDATTSRVVYIHDGLVINDVEAKIAELSQHVLELADTVFDFLCSQLQPVEIRTTCGVYRGRFYERLVEYAPNLDFNSGSCYSKRWFEHEAEFLCPMRNNCGAYAR